MRACKRTPAPCWGPGAGKGPKAVGLAGEGSSEPGSRRENTMSGLGGLQVGVGGASEA